MCLRTTSSLCTYPSLSGHQRCFHVWAVVSKSAADMGVQVSFPDNEFISFLQIPEVKLLDARVVLLLMWGGTTHCFPHCFLFSFSKGFYTIPLNRPTRKEGCGSPPPITPCPPPHPDPTQPTFRPQASSGREQTLGTNL